MRDGVPYQVDDGDVSDARYACYDANYVYYGAKCCDENCEFHDGSCEWADEGYDRARKGKISRTSLCIVDNDF